MNIYEKGGSYEKEILIIVLYNVQSITSVIMNIWDLYIILVETQKEIYK
jgi:hypothetical protein